MKKISIPKNDINQDLEFRSLVIIGANGSGKSRLGIKIEESTTNSHRIGAQRSLVFAEEIAVRSANVAESFVQFGTYSAEPSWNEDQRHQNAKKNRRSNRWGSRPESHLLSDFDYVLTLLVAYEYAQNAEFKKQFKGGTHPPKYPTSHLDRVQRVWNLVMPHRQIEIVDNRLQASHSSAAATYHAIGMSDGERVAFYLIAQAMCVPKDALIIIDEPEIHLHKAIQAGLWDAIESERADCSFIYITHDLDFAATRIDASKIWVREFDGSKWKWDLISEIDGFPSELVLEILGSRKPILFVEGTKSSIDTQLYRRIYPDFYVIPREGCGKVVESTVALNQSSGFHSQNAFGIVDRDYRADTQIASLLKDKVSTTMVAEAENGICLPCIVRAAARHLKRDEEAVLQKVTDISFGLLQTQIEKQVKDRATQEIRHSLAGFSSKGIGSRAEFLDALFKFKGEINGERYYDEARTKYNNAIGSRDYEGLLQLFNNKGLEDAIAKAIGFASRQIFRSWVLAELDSADRSDCPSTLGMEMLNGLRAAFPIISPTPKSESVVGLSNLNDSIIEEAVDGHVS